MKKIVVLFVVLISVQNITAQDKTTEIKKLFKVMKSSEMIDKMMDGMLPMLKQQMASSITGAEKTKKMETMMNFINEESKKFTKNLMDKEMAAIYAKHFELNEIQDLIKFYKSPTGQKMIEKTPVITQELMSSMMTKELPVFQQKISDKIKELQ